MISKKLRKSIDYKWLFKMSILTFILSIIFALVSSSVMEKLNMVLSSFILLGIILLGILIDIIGVSITTANAVPFHSMASRKVKGAKEAIQLINSKEKASNFCNDVIGDTCGIISGCAGTVLVTHIVERSEFASKQSMLIDVLVAGLIAAITVGGRSAGKAIAISNCNYITLKTAKFLNFFNILNMQKSTKRKKSI